MDLRRARQRAAQSRGRQEHGEPCDACRRIQLLPSLWSALLVRSMLPVKNESPRPSSCGRKPLAQTSCTGLASDSSSTFTHDGNSSPPALVWRSYLARRDGVSTNHAWTLLTFVPRRATCDQDRGGPGRSERLSVAQGASTRAWREGFAPPGHPAWPPSSAAGGDPAAASTSGTLVPRGARGGAPGRASQVVAWVARLAAWACLGGRRPPHLEVVKDALERVRRWVQLSHVAGRHGSVRGPGPGDLQGVPVDGHAPAFLCRRPTAGRIRHTLGSA